jgi:hypothetical protein
MPLQKSGPRHVPLAAWVKCYIIFASRRKRDSTTFVAVHESQIGPERTSFDVRYETLLSSADEVIE